MKIIRDSFSKYGVLLLFVLLGIILLPHVITTFFPSPGLDPSYQIGLYQIAHKGGQYGSDIAFTFGPLGFLTYGLYYSSFLLSFSLIMMFFSLVLILLSFTLFLKQSSVDWKNCVLICGLLLLLIPMIYEYTNIVAIGIILYLIAMRYFENRTEYYLYILIAAVIGLTSLIKLQLMISNLTMIAALLLIAVIERDKKRFKYYLLLPVLSFCFFIFFWFIAGQNLPNLLPFILNGLQSVAGYSEAMAVNYGPYWQIILGVFSLIFFIALFLYTFIKRITALWFFLFIFSGLLFFSFKHGFVRHDMHVILFFGVYGVISLCCYIVTFVTVHSPVRFLFLFMTFLFIGGSIMQIGYTNYVWGTIREEKNFYGIDGMEPEPLAIILDPSYREIKLEWSRSAIKEYYPISNNTIEYIGSNSIDSFPGDIALFWLYGMNWSPRPTLNSITAYTNKLEKLNARHFALEDAPTIVLYRYESIDGRYPLFDEPATFATVLQEYNLVKRDGDFLILSHRFSPVMKENKDLGSVNAKFGEKVTIPDYSSGYVFAHIDIDYSLYGILMKTIYKPSKVYIKFQFNDSSPSSEYRLIPGLAENGLFVSHYVENVDDLASVFTKNFENDISGIIIYSDSPSQFKNAYTVKFSGIPANITHEISPDIVPQWKNLNEVTGGEMHIDLINGKIFTNRFEKIEIPSNSIVRFDGWAIDDQNKTGDVQVFLIFKGETEELIIPTQKSKRDDVAEFFGEPNYSSSGWSARVNPEILRDRCFNVSVRIINAEGTGYYQPTNNDSVCFS